MSNTRLDVIKWSLFYVGKKYVLSPNLFYSKYLHKFKKKKKNYHYRYNNNNDKDFMHICTICTILRLLPEDANNLRRQCV